MQNNEKFSNNRYFFINSYFTWVSQAQKLKELKKLSLPTVAEELRQIRTFLLTRDYQF